jgi:hypothetical protein
LLRQQHGNNLRAIWQAISSINCESFLASQTTRFHKFK